MWPDYKQKMNAILIVLDGGWAHQWWCRRRRARHSRPRPHTDTTTTSTQGVHHVSMRNLKTNCMAQPSGMVPKAGVVHKHHNAGPPNMEYPSINTPSNDTKTCHPDMKTPYGLRHAPAARAS